MTVANVWLRLRESRLTNKTKENEGMVRMRKIFKVCGKELIPRA